MFPFQGVQLRLFSLNLVVGSGYLVNIVISYTEYYTLCLSICQVFSYIYFTLESKL